MTWITTKTAKFIKEEIVGIQFLPNNYSRTIDALVISLRGGAQMTFTDEEANTLWAKLGGKDSEMALSES